MPPSTHRPRGVSFWVDPGDSYLLDDQQLLKLVAFDQHSATFQLTLIDGRLLEDVQVAMGDWRLITPKLQLRYDGVYVNDRCRPAEQAGVTLDDTDSTEVRFYARRGIRISNPDRIGRPR